MSVQLLDCDTLVANKKKTKQLFVQQSSVNSKCSIRTELGSVVPITTCLFRIINSSVFDSEGAAWLKSFTVVLAARYN